MQALRNSVYLIVTIGSIAMAACQPFDGFTESAGRDASQPTRQVALEVDNSAASRVESPVNSR